MNNLISLFCFLIFNTAFLVAQQTTYTCNNSNFSFLSQALGTWEVETLDRTSPGEYEKNKGVAQITEGIPGCGISISYRGTYREKDYAREVHITGLDSTAVQMATLDSEHGSFSILNGTVDGEKMELYWYRDKEKKRLQSKYIMTFQSKDAFEFSSFLSTDYGKTWALTHERKYKRKK